MTLYVLHNNKLIVFKFISKYIIRTNKCIVWLWVPFNPYSYGVDRYNNISWTSN